MGAGLAPEHAGMAAGEYAEASAANRRGERGASGKAAADQAEAEDAALAGDGLDRRARERRRRARREREMAAKLRESTSASLAKDWSAALSEVEGRGGLHAPASGKHLVKLARVGVPPRIRARVWRALLGNRLQVNGALYEIFATRAKTARQAMMSRAAAEAKATRESAAAAAAIEDASDEAKAGGSTTEEHSLGRVSPTSALSGDASAGGSSVSGSGTSDNMAAMAYVATLAGNEASVISIERDIPRTFPELAFFAQSGPMYDPLLSVMSAYTFYRPDVGYKQGMSHLAAVFFLVFDSEVDTFVSLANILARTPLRFIVASQDDLMAEWYNIFDGALERELPKLHRYFQDIYLTPSFYLLPWLVTLFTKALPLDMALQVWDRYLVERHPLLMRVSLAILRCMQPQLLEMPLEQCTKALVRLPDEVSEQQLRHAIDETKLSPEELKRLSRMGEE